MKDSKDSDSSLVFNKNVTKILWPSGWALGQVTWAKMAQKLLHYDVTQKKSATPNKKKFFRVQTRRRAEFWGFEQPSNAIGGGAMALARQPKTTGFRLKSRYDIFVERLSK